MSNELLITKYDVDNVDKIFSFYIETSKVVDKLQRIKDPVNEKIFQNGVRPKSGASNDPDRLYSEEAHLAAMMNSVNPAIMPKEFKGLLKPAATLYEWLFKRLCIDLKNMAKLPEDQFMAYIALIDEGVADAKKEMTDIKAKRPALTAEVSIQEFMKLDPEQQHYFVAVLNVVTFEALSSILKVIYCQWYPTAKK